MEKSAEAMIGLIIPEGNGNRESDLGMVADEAGIDDVVDGK